jgi:hypothetical protein
VKLAVKSKLDKYENWPAIPRLCSPTNENNSCAYKIYFIPFTIVSLISVNYCFTLPVCRMYFRQCRSPKHGQSTQASIAVNATISVFSLMAK